MKTPITNELLHHNGWKSFVNDDESYFIFDDIILLYSPEEKIWGISGRKENIKYWEELLEVYREIKNKPFIPCKPIQETDQFKIKIENIPGDF